MDEAIMVLVVFGITIFHTITMTPYWFKLMELSMVFTSLNPGTLFTILMAAFTILTILIYYLFAIPAGLLSKGGVGTAFINFAYPLIPLALFFHLGHNVLHLFGEGQKIVVVASDPFGWGWDIFGTARTSLEPIISLSIIPYIQWVMVLTGFGFSIYLSYRVRMGWRGFVPVAVMIIMLTVAYLWMLSQPMVMRMG
ncbi:MAG: hypothetical protein HY878_06755 [Deltaproteobacteria bacterium]|nr:hypothetical protein [Deltaproteobacteria bacterium]